MVTLAGCSVLPSGNWQWLLQTMARHGGLMCNVESAYVSGPIFRVHSAYPEK
jgi:hypothetical protein